jgi:hypothetical protein
VRKNLAIALGLACSLGLAAQASTREGEADYTGTVTVVELRNGDQLVVKEITGSQRVLQLDQGTEIREDGKSMAPSALKRGHRVAVTANYEGSTTDRRLVAERIRLVSAPAPPAAATKPGGPAPMKPGATRPPEPPEPIG